MVFGGDSVFAERLMVRSNTNNASFFMNMMTELTEREHDIPVITPRSFSAATFEISRSQAELLGLIFAVFLPIAFIALGVVVWVRRVLRVFFS
jgi:hypothetical protein